MLGRLGSVVAAPGNVAVILLTDTPHTGFVRLRILPRQLRLLLFVKRECSPLDVVPQKSTYLGDVGEGQTRVDQAHLA